MEGKQFGNYQLLAPLGRGGMGEVWRANHVRLGRAAAVKLIRPEALRVVEGEEPPLTVLRRFEREAKATSQLKSPHTVEVYDYGTTPDGIFFYAMELLEGVDMKSLVERFGPLPAERVVHMLLQACESLEEAHRAGLVHRDIKPANLFTCRLGLQVDFVKVLDFGLVKPTSAGGKEVSQLTTDGVAPGSPAFIAPEVARGRGAIDARTDIYSLGCVAYWLLTGALVFDAESPLAMVLAHLDKTPVPPTQRTELPVPEALETLVLECLAKQQDDRPASMQVVAERLESVPVDNPWSRERARKWWELHRPFEGWGPVGVVGTGATEGETPRPRPPDSDPALAEQRQHTLGALQDAFAHDRLNENELSRRTELAEYASSSGELDALVADLLEQRPEGAMVLARDQVPARAAGKDVEQGALVRARPEKQRIIAILSGVTRRGRWRPARRLRTYNFMGGTELDFREADLEPGMLDLRCYAFMGGVNITVPPDLYVEVHGGAFMGGFDQKDGGGAGPSDDRPWLRIGGFLVMGGVEVRVKPRRGEEE